MSVLISISEQVAKSVTIYATDWLQTKSYGRPIPALWWCKNDKTMAKYRPHCCFNHLIGLPTLKIKNEETGETLAGQEMPIFPYEDEIIYNIQKHKFYALNKARGIGASEIILRWILFKAITNTVKDRKFIIVPGTRKELAKDLLRRLKNMLQNIDYVSKGQPSDYVVRINKSFVIAMPAAPDVIRGLENVEVIMLDESGFWKMLDDTPVLEAAEPHKVKSNAWIITLSTPNGQRGFFYRIFAAEKSMYYRHTLNWTVSAGLLINPKDVEEIRKEDPYKYEQEYNNQFLSTRYSAIPIEIQESAYEEADDFTMEDLNI